MASLPTLLRDLTENINRLEKRTHSNTVIASAAILDAQLEKCLRKAMRPMPKKMSDRLFGNLGPLGSFSAKISMAYAFRIVERETYDRLELMRKIRNEFAHSTDQLHLDSAVVAPFFDRLKKLVTVKGKRVDMQYLECLQSIDRELDLYLGVGSPSR